MVNITISRLERFLSTPWSGGLLAFVSSIAVVIAFYLIFLVAPDERIMGAVQRMLYLHVGSVMAAYLMIAVVLVGSLSFLASRNLAWDLIAQSAASVGFLFCSVVLATGMIWGHSSWNTWWRWEPRLTSFLVLWLLFFGYEVMRAFTAREERQAVYASVLGILLAVNVPVVIFSIKLWSQTEQLHPQVVANQGLRDERYVYAMVAGIVAMLLVSTWLWMVRTYQLILEDRLRELAAE